MHTRIISLCLPCACRYQELVEGAKQAMEDRVKGAAAENDALVEQLAEARAEVVRMRELFDGKELELRDANAMSRDQSTRAVIAETKVRACKAC